jgi:hypothetical protein
MYYVLVNWLYAFAVFTNLDFMHFLILTTATENLF